MTSNLINYARAVCSSCGLVFLLANCGGVPDPNSSSSHSSMTSTSSSETTNSASSISFVSSSSSSGSTNALCSATAAKTFKGVAFVIPGRIEAEDFDPDGVSDSTSENEGGAYRQDTAVDIKALRSGFAVGWMTSGEYLEYTIDVASEGDYELFIRAGAAGAGRTVEISQCDSDKMSQINIPNVANWGQFKTVSSGFIHLRAGMQKIRLTVGEVSYMDIDWVQIGGMVDTSDDLVPDPVACEASAGTNPISIVVDGNNIKPNNVNGLTFKGFGALSANGTSAMLLDYKSQQPEKYRELLQVLFGGSNPLINHVKIEMGNDRNNSTGPDSASMRTENEAANVKRLPAFQFAADAKKLNPNLKVSILRWNAPGWVKNNDQIYTWYKKTILAAYREYGYMVDFVNPGVNEQAANLNWAKQYAGLIKAENTGFQDNTEKTLYNKIKVMISDEVSVGSFGGVMVSDASLRSAVPIAGYHYSTDDDSAGNFKRLADQLDIEIWNSEAQATFSNTAFRPNNNVRDPSVAGTGIGGTNGPLEMGNTIIKGFVNSRRTHFIYQPAIGSFYSGSRYSFKELISARDPWSGWIHYDAAVQVLRHFTWFAKTGWENGNNSAGIWRGVPQSSTTGAVGTNPVSGRNGTPSYMTLAAPDKSQFSTVFVNDSEQTKTYALKTVNMSYSNQPALEVWETRAHDAGEAFNDNYMKYQCDLSADGGGTYNITVKPFSVVTVTTLPNRNNPDFHQPLPVEGERVILDTDETGETQNTSDNILYQDDFEYANKTVPVISQGGASTSTEGFIDSRGGDQGAIPRYLSARNGGFEVVLVNGTNNRALRQQVDQSIMGLGGTWHSGSPIAAIGDFRWLNYKASVDVSFGNNLADIGNNYAQIGARQQGGDSSHFSEGTPYLLKFLFNGNWQLLVDAKMVASGNVTNGSGPQINNFNSNPSAWHNLALEVVENRITAYLDGVKMAEYTDSKPRLSGRVDLGSGYYYTLFDNLKVEKIAGYPAYYSELLDNMEMHDLGLYADDKLIYSGNWAHANGKSMYNYERSLSTSQASGATLEYTFEGTGLDILGPNNGSAVLEVVVDGNTVDASARTVAATEFYQTYTLRGLNQGMHTVKIRVVSGTLVVDAVAVVQ